MKASKTEGMKKERQGTGEAETADLWPCHFVVRRSQPLWVWASGYKGLRIKV